MKPQQSAGVESRNETRGISRALAALVAAAVLPLLLFGIIAAILTVNQKKEAAATELGHVVRALRVAVDRELHGQFRALEMLASDPSLDQADPEAFRRRALRAIEARPEWRNVALIDAADYRILASVRELPADASHSLARDEIDQLAQRRAPAVAAAFPLGKIANTPVLLLLAPVERAGRVRHVLSVNLDPKRLNDLFAEQQLSPTWTGSVLDAGKRIAGRSRDPERYLGVPATPSLAERVGPDEGGMFSALNQEGQTVSAMFSRSAETGWTVVIGVPVAEIDGPLRRFLIELSLLGAALLAFGLTLTYAVGSAIVRRRDAYERSLRESRERLEELLRDHNDLLERIPIGVYKYRMLKDGGERFDFVSPQMCRQLGESAEAIYREPALAFKCSGERELAELRRANDEARASLKPFTWEGPMNGPHGKVWLRMESVPTVLPGGDLLWNGFQYDVTERVRNAEQYRSIIQAALDGFWVTDGTGRILDANPAICRTHGYAREELVGLRIADIEADESQTEIAARTREIVERGHVQFEARHRRKDGAVINVEVSAVYLPDLGERFYAFVRDVTARKQAELRLQESEAKFRAVFENSMDATFLTSTDGGILAANPAAQQMLGYGEAELRALGRGGVVDLTDPRLPAALEQRRRSGRFHGELTFIDKRGRRFPVEVSTSVFADREGLQMSSMSVRDISERKRTHQQLIESENRLQTIIRLEPECIKIIDEQGLLRLMNPAGLAMVEAESLEQVAGRPVAELIAPAYRDAYLDLHRRVISGQPARMEYEIVGLRGGRRWVETSAVPMREDGAVLHLAVTRDVTERKRMEDQVRQLAFHDDLTRLPNRRLLHDHLGRVMSATRRSGRYGALMFLDLDHFKPLNDVQGHEVGDLLLIEVARRLGECVRGSDTVARFGGDEFVVLLDDLSQDRTESRRQAGAIAEKIRAALAEPYHLALPHDPAVEIEHRCAASIGVVLFAGHEASQDDLLKWADATMYRAKEAGRDRVEFYETPG